MAPLFCFGASWAIGRLRNCDEIMVNLGDVRPEEVRSDSPGMSVPTEYSPSGDLEVLRNDFVRFFNGVSQGGYDYRIAHRADIASTYVLRVVAFRGSVYRQLRDSRYDVLADDTRADVLIVFRVVDRD